MVVYGNLPARLYGEVAEPVFWIAGPVVPVTGQPTDTRAEHITHLPLEREFLDFHIFAILEMSHIHLLLSF
jgi:hypothetical protein